MNICFLYGKIISEVEFRFFYNSKKHISVVKFELEDYNAFSSKYNYNQVFAYDEIADVIYSEFETKDFICFRGKIENNAIRVLEIYQ